MCGIIGISNRKKPASLDVYDGLLMLQHRGQDAAGMVTLENRRFHEKRDNGLVKDVFRQEDMHFLKGHKALGHCRYPTAGSSSASEAQPFFVNSPFGMYLIHNGNLTNAHILREQMPLHYRHLRTESDTEVLLNMFASFCYHELKKEDKNNIDIKRILQNATKNTMQAVTGAYSCLMLIDEAGLFAFRDPKGIRPLVLGKRMTPAGAEYGFASEDTSLKALGFTIERDVRPGEAILIDFEGNLHSFECQKGETNPCIFEYVYLARPDSTLNGISVYKTRMRMGSKLANQVKKAGLIESIDAIIPVPDSSRPVAMQMAQDLGIPYREGLIKNRYVGRTFIMPGQGMRKRSIRQKLSPVDLEFKGKNIMLVDDSIVRGNTMKRIVQMCKASGANKIYVASGAPPVRFPDVYGVDIPNRKELIANNLSESEIATVLGVDALFYQTVEDLIECARVGNPEITKFATGCFDSGYVTPEVTEEYLHWVENTGRGAYEFKETPQAQLINI